MVPLPDSIYFPPLERCFSGEELLISWETAFEVLNDEAAWHREHKNLERFLSDNDAVKLLTRPFNPYSFSASNSKSTFETKTAAINVTPTSTSHYNINEIKEDAVWLSKEAQIDELSALRIIVLEYQSQSSAQLQSSFADEELTSLRDVAGDLSTETSALLSKTISSNSNSSFKPYDGSQIQDARRLRALHTYLSERRHLLKCTQLLLHIGLRYQLSTENGSRGAQDSPPTWTERAGQNLTRAVEQANEGYTKFLLYCIRELKSNIEMTSGGGGLMKSASLKEKVELDWLSNQLTEAIHAMELIFILLEYRKAPVTASLVVEWFRFTSTYGFFDRFEPPDESLQLLVLYLQNQVSIISLSILDFQGILALIAESPFGITTAEEVYNATPESIASESSYVTDITAVRELHDILQATAAASSLVGSTAVFVWAIILQAIRKAAMSLQDYHDTRQIEMEGSDNPDNPRSSTSARESPTARNDAAESNSYRNILDETLDSSLDEDPIHFLARSAVDGGHVFDVLMTIAADFTFAAGTVLQFSLGNSVRGQILDLVRCCIGMTGYIPEVVTTAMLALGGSQKYWNLIQTRPLPLEENPVTRLLGDEYLVETLLDAAKSRYPYENAPLVQLLRAIASSPSLTGEELQNLISMLSMNTITYVLPPDFKEYEAIQEEENNNAVESTQDFLLFEPRANKMALLGNAGYTDGLLQVAQGLCVPAGSQGRIVSDTGPRVAIWQYQYSGLKYMGKLLETSLAAGDFVDAITGQPADNDSLTDIISFVSTLIFACARLEQQNGMSKVSAYGLLEELSDGLNERNDIISVVFKIFEEELYRQAEGQAESSTALLVSCVQFIHAITTVLPGRVWPFLSRCGLLDDEGRTGGLAKVLVTIEFISSRYDFLLSCVYLFQVLIEDSTKNAVIRKGNTKSITRFANPESRSTGIPDQGMTKVLTSFSTTLISVMETSCNWKYAIPEQRLRLSTLIPKILDRILQLTHGIDDLSNSPTKLTSPLMPSATKIIDSFLSPAASKLRFQSTLRAFLDGVATPGYTYNLPLLALWIDYVSATLIFTRTLIRLGTLLEHPNFALQEQLFDALPLLARLFSVHQTYTVPVITLLEAVVLRAAFDASDEEEPTSLLGRLGQQTSRYFINILTGLGKPLDDDFHVLPIWNFASTIISSRQRWFAIYLLNGGPPRESGKKEDESANASAHPSNSLLRIALRDMSDIKSLSPQRAPAILEFISLAQNFWPWAMSELQRRSETILTLLDHTREWPLPANTMKVDQTLQSAFEIMTAAFIAEIVAMYLFHSRQANNDAIIKSVLPRIDYYTRWTLVPPSYNTSLHTNLKRNFEAKFPGRRLQEFKRTTLNRRSFGRDYFYDLETAAKMLSFDESWRGKKEDGFSEEFALANVNLSLVDAQVALLRGWKMLATELSTEIPKESILPKILTETIFGCLRINTREQPPEKIFSVMCQQRAELALLLFQRLVESKCQSKDMLKLLPSAWEAYRSLNMSLGQALSSDDGDYVRTLLRILFLALRVQQGLRGWDPALSDGDSGRTEAVMRTVQIVLSILETVVARGFRELAALVHENLARSSPGDIGLITAVLQACLQVPGIDGYSDHIMGFMNTSNVSRVAVTLYSWAHDFTIDGDPVYGELSVLFLLELSSIPAAAEQLAVEGILGQLSTASLTSYIRRANISAFASSAGPQRCYNIWARGILPLVLNLLEAVGPSIATEVALFLNQFPSLLKQSTEHFAAPDVGRRMVKMQHEPRLAYSVVAETHSLALLTFILSRYRTMVGIGSEIPEVDWDVSSVSENLEVWLGNRKTLRERIIPMSATEVGMANKRPLSAKDGCTNRLEEKVVEELQGIKEILNAGEV